MHKSQNSKENMPIMAATRLKTVALLFILSLFSAATTFAADPFTWSAKLDSNQVQAGEETTLRVSVSVPEDHLLYKYMMSFSIAEHANVQAGETVYPEAEKIADPFDPDGKEKEIYRQDSTFLIPLQISSNASSGTYEINLTVGYQGCSSTVCFFPNRVKFTEKLYVEGSTQATEEMTSTPPALTDYSSPDQKPVEPKSEAGFAGAIGKGIFWAFLFVFGAGVLTSFTPCVYPLIPITISLFGAREASSRMKSFLLSVTYVLGIATMYSVLGVAAAASGAVFGQFMTNPWVISVVALVFVIFGISMLGGFEIQLPASIQQRISRAGGKGFGGAFTMGLFGGIVAAPCTGPALGAVLTYVATTQNLVLGFWLLFTFAWGLGMLFLALGTFSGLISRLPKSGGWMNGVKSVFGVVMFTFALYFLKDAFPFLKSVLNHSAPYFIAAGVLVVVGIALGAIHRTFHDPSKLVRFAKGAGVLLMTLGLFIGLGSATSVGTDLPEPHWIYSDIDGLELAKAEGKPVMIDFWAEWCAACKELDHKTYTDPRVLKRLEDFVVVKLDFTESNEITRELTEKYEIVGLPTIVFYDSRGNLLPDKRLIGFLDADAFLEHIEGI